jgi:hypothetical protein
MQKHDEQDQQRFATSKRDAAARRRDFVAIVVGALSAIIKFAYP